MKSFCVIEASSYLSEGNFSLKGIIEESVMFHVCSPGSIYPLEGLVLSATFIIVKIDRIPLLPV